MRRNMPRLNTPKAFHRVGRNEFLALVPNVFLFAVVDGGMPGEFLADRLRMLASSVFKSPSNRSVLPMTVLRVSTAQILDLD